MGVEPMEGRLMLSAAPADFTAATTFQATQFALGFGETIASEVGNANPGNGQAANVAAFSEGGFVSFVTPQPGGLIANGANVDGMLSGAISPNAQHSIPRLTVSDSNLGVNGADAAVVFGETGLPWGFDLRPAVIPPIVHGGNLSPTIDLNLSGKSWDHGIDRAPGGTIPIDRLLARDIPDADSNAADKSLMMIVDDSARDAGESNRLSAEVPENDAWSSRPIETRLTADEGPGPVDVALDPSGPKLAASSDGAIFGEWARAMSFETAGGEPLGSRRVASEVNAEQESSGDQSGNGGEGSAVYDETILREAAQDEPAQLEAAQLEAGQLGPESRAPMQRETAASRKSAANFVRSAGHTASGHVGSIALRQYGGLSAALIERREGLRSSATSVAGRLAPDALAPVAGELAHTAIEADQVATSQSLVVACAEVFEQQETSDEVFAQSSKDDGVPWASSVVAPLVMLLAWERIAARNAKRVEEYAAAIK
jgi:hypothetical protein